MSAYKHLYKHLYHIFRNLDAQFLILDCDLENPKMTTKKDLTLIKYKKIVERNLDKIQNIMKHKKFRNLNPCCCLNCSGDYEEFQVCEIDSCPVAVDCQWSNWTKEGKCSKTCGIGIQKWFRHKLQEEINSVLFTFDCF